MRSTPALSQCALVFLIQKSATTVNIMTLITTTLGAMDLVTTLSTNDNQHQVSLLLENVFIVMLSDVMLIVVILSIMAS
jgi:hypothetical protein